MQQIRHLCIKFKKVSFVDCWKGRESLTIILRPPREVATSDHIVEKKADNRPRDVVNSRSWRNRASSVENDGEVNVLDDGIWPLARDYVANGGANSTNKEEESQATFQRSMSEAVTQEKLVVTY